MILGLIPARSGSKGIPGKNIKEFCGKPLIEYAIEVGLRCKFIDKVMVSTDDKDTAEVVYKHWREKGDLVGLTLLKRSKKLAQDDTPMMPVIQNAVKLSDGIDTVVLIDPTNPLRTVEDVEGAWKLFNTKDTDCVVSGCEAKYHPDFNLVTPWVLSKSHTGWIRVWGADLWDNDYKEVGSRQECEDCYQLDTTVWIYSREAIEKGKRIPERTRLYLVPPERSASIDTQLDWDVAEFLYERGQGV